MHKLIHSESHSIWLCWCIVHCAFLASPTITITHIKHSHAYNLQLDYAHCPSCQPSFHTSSLKPPPILQPFQIRFIRPKHPPPDPHSPHHLLSPPPPIKK